MRPFIHGSRTAIIAVSMGLALGGLTACRDLTAKLPAGYTDPAFYTTADAGVKMARNVRYEFQAELLGFMFDAGLIADEFHNRLGSNQQVVGFYNAGVVLESRHLPDLAMENVSTVIRVSIDSTNRYRNLQRIRSRSGLARQSLRKYASDSTAILQAELAAYEGFAEVMLADLYCSGIPLSVVEFEGDFQYRPGSRTADVYAHAIVLFDTAIALAGSDARISALGRIGKGRALLALGRYREAAAAVAEVPEGYRFNLPLMRLPGTLTNPTGLLWTSGFVPLYGQIADKKGTNGINFLSAQDPRIKKQSLVKVASPVVAAQTHVVVANDLEARLIEAEAKLHEGDPQWLVLLNTLRTDGTVIVDANSVAHYGAGTGGVPDLPPLSDPGLAPLSPGKTVQDVRVDLLMRERAFWLFFRGIRQGDLRRLIRNYDRTISTVYPQGPFPSGSGFYEQYVDIPIPGSERPNPHFSGCLGRGE